MRKKPLFWKYASDDSYDEIGVALSESDSRKCIVHFIGELSMDAYIEVKECSHGYFAIIFEDY